MEKDEFRNRLEEEKVVRMRGLASVIALTVLYVAMSGLCFLIRDAHIISAITGLIVLLISSGVMLTMLILTVTLLHVRQTLIMQPAYDKLFEVRSEVHEKLKKVDKPLADKYEAFENLWVSRYGFQPVEE